jgi:AraC-like DNA-binding protein
MDDMTSSFSVLRLVPKFGDIRYHVADGAPPYRAVADMLAIPVRRLISRRAVQTEADLAARPPASAIAQHNHRELFLVLSGSIDFVIAGRTFAAHAGDMLFTDRWEPHGAGLAAGSRPAYVAVFHFNATPWACVSEVMPNRANDAIFLDTYHFLGADAVAFFSRRLREAAKRVFHDRFAELALPAANALACDYRRALALRALEREGAASDPIWRTIVRIRDSAGRGCAVKELAENAGMSRTYFAKAFAERTGMTVRRAIEQARFDLYRIARINGHSQKEIADALGFSAVSHFNRWLRHVRTGGSGDARPRCRVGDLTTIADASRLGIDRAVALGAIPEDEARRHREVIEACLETEREMRAISPKTEKAEFEAPLMEIVRSYIKSANGAGCSLAALAQAFGLSRYRLAHRYRAEQGETIGDTIAAARIAYVRAALRQGTSLKTICRATGFATPSAFCAWRRKTLKR